MRTLSKYLLLLALLLITISSKSNSQVTFSGLMFGDMFYNASNHDSTIEGKSGFWIRRAYLTADYKLDDKVSGRLNFEMNSTGDLKTGTNLTPFVKDAWLKYQTNFTGKDFFVFGIQPTPTFGFVENQWGFRPVEKSIIDLQSLRPARDFGISYQGEASIFKWNILYGNNQSVNSLVSDINKDTRRISTSVQVRPIDDLVVELYTDMDLQARELKLKGETNTVSTNSHIFIGYNQKDWRVGALYSMLKDTKRVFDTTNTETKYNMMMVYAAYKITSDLEAFVRYDNLDHSNTKTIAYVPISNKSAPSTIIAGLAYSLNASTKIIPNIEYISYKKEDDKGVTLAENILPKNDLYIKLTFSTVFK